MARRPPSVPGKPAPAGKDGGRGKRTGGSGIRIRMYRVGFGDCFLVSFPVAAGMQHVLVDCGVHNQGDIGTMRQAVANVAAECGGELALVIATHAHQDHISGFGTFADEFKALRVREVWMPWSEDPADKDAVRFRKKQAALAEQLHQQLAAAPRPAAREDAEKRDKALHALQNLAPNRVALDLLKAGINGGKVRFLGAGPKIEDAAGIAGLSVQVLGPPRDQAFLARMDPPAGDRFLRLGADGALVAGAISPFDARWTTGEDAFPAGIIKPEEHQALEQLAFDPDGLAFTLDQAMNNTSLVTLFSFAGQNLLFPGDAQYGNWQYWVDKPDAAEILASVDFYKVGHHGSHNATPKSALDKMTKGRFAAMISTQDTPWPSIPFEELLTALTSQSKGYVRSDTIPVANAKTEPAAPLPPGFSHDGIWYDYTIPV
jgi:beta-lactamase superfamily II metal-dependent hydrolase